MFQQIKDSLGQMDGENKYQLKTAVNATVVRVRELEYSKTNGKPAQSLVLKDDDGEEEWVKLTGKFDPLQAGQVFQKYEFLVWPFKPQQSPKTYLYCWIQRQVNQNSQPPQSVSQRPPQPPQQANGNGGIITQVQLIQLAERFIQAIEYVVHGNIEPPKSNVNPDYVGDEPAPVDDSDIIPF